MEFLRKILIQTVRIPELLGGAKILSKSSSLCLGCNNITDDRDNRRTARAITEHNIPLKSFNCSSVGISKYGASHCASHRGSGGGVGKGHLPSPQLQR